MNRAEADAQLKDAELVACIEGAVNQARELERRLLENGIPTLMAAKPKSACCGGGGCGCGAKVQLLIRPEDGIKVQALLHDEWLEAVRREGHEGALTQLNGPEGESLACPACGFAGALVAGACGDCGLQLE